MAIKDRKDLFVWLLSNALQAAEKTSKIPEELAKYADDPRIKEAIEARVFIDKKDVDTLNQCFKVLGAQPSKDAGRLQETFIEDFRREISEIQDPDAKRLFFLAKFIRYVHMRMGEYEALVSAADLSGNYAIGALLSSVLADKMALADRTQHLMRHMVKERLIERRAA